MRQPGWPFGVPGHPAACAGACADFVVKKGRALYHKFPADPNTCERCRVAPGQFPTMHHPEPMSRAEDRLGRVSIKDHADQEAMRVAGRLASEALDMIGPHVVPGVSTEELDRICHDYIVDVQRAIPAPLGYRGYPKSICTSVNHVVCHGIPGDRRLKQGDIVNVDVTVIKDGFHGDSSRMYAVGKIAPHAQRLIDVTYDGDVARHTRRAPRRAARRHRVCNPAVRGGEPLQCRARVLRARHRSRLPRGSAGAALRSARHGAHAAGPA